MNRRDVLRLATLATGYSLLSPLSATLLAGCTDKSRSIELIDSDVGDRPAFFTKDDLMDIEQIMDTILPRTDSPSASDVGVPAIMDQFFASIFDPEYTATFMRKFSTFKTALKKANFSQQTPAQREALLLLLADSDDIAITSTLADIKQQTIAYYLSTETIAENYLNYLPIPGEYIAKTSVEAVGGKRWAE